MRSWYWDGGRHWRRCGTGERRRSFGPREARAAKALTVVLESEVTILDPHVTTAAITRTFGLHVFDMLFAMNEKGEIKPQMVDSFDSQRRQAHLDLHAARRPQVA